MSSETSPILSATALIDAVDLPEKVVEVPEWGGSVRLRALTVGQVADCRERSTVRGEVDGLQMDLHWLVEAMVEPQLTHDQVGQLMAKSQAVVQRLVGEAVVLNSAGVEALAARFPAGAVATGGVPAGAGAGDDSDATAS